MQDCKRVREDRVEMVFKQMSMLPGLPNKTASIVFQIISKFDYQQFQSYLKSLCLIKQKRS
jgi:hypothetical protein